VSVPWWMPGFLSSSPAMRPTTFEGMAKRCLRVGRTDRGLIDADHLAVDVDQRPPELPGLIGAEVCSKPLKSIAERFRSGSLRRG